MRITCGESQEYILDSVYKASSELTLEDESSNIQSIIKNNYNITPEYSSFDFRMSSKKVAIRVGISVTIYLIILIVLIVVQEFT